MERLAQVHQVASQGFDSTSASVAQGTLGLRLGDGTLKTITVDASNATLQGLADAINAAQAGVTAAILDDGAGSHRYRLLLTASKTGTAHAIQVVNGLTGGTGIRPEFAAASIGPAELSAGFTGTSSPTSSGTYTGSNNDVFAFTVQNGGTVGTDSGIQVGYTNKDGSVAGTLTVNPGDVGNPLAAGAGIQVAFGAGTLVAGETFTVKAFVPEVQQAADAVVVFGSGPGTLTVNQSSNRSDNLLPGLAIDLKKADPGRTITLTVEQGVAQAEQAVKDFVGAYNDLTAFIDQQVRYDSETNQAGPLLGDSRATRIQDALRTLTSGIVPGTGQQMNRLAAVGITLDDRGRMVLDAGKLNAALTGQNAGSGFEEVRKLFALAGTSPQPVLQFVTGSQQTRTTGHPYQVVVTQAAAQAVLAATNPLGPSSVVDAGSDEVLLAINGAPPRTLTLTAGTYTPAQLAAELQARIDAEADLAGRMTVAVNGGGRLTLTSRDFGEFQTFSLAGGDALGLLGLTGAEIGAGNDVAGHFVAEGHTEPATGSGRFLTGTTGNTTGLQVRVLADAAQVGGGLTLDLTVTRGIASALDVALAGMLDPINGRLQTIDDGYDTDLARLDTEIDRQTDLMESRRARLLRQFVALETTVSQLQGMGNFLASQFAQLQPVQRRN